MADPTIQAYARVTNSGADYLNHPLKRILVSGYDFVADATYDEQYPMWRTIRDCYAGEAAIKAAGETYLRKLSAHDAEAYKSYLSRGYFYNGVRRTHTGLMGSLFRKLPEFTIPPSVKIDLNSLTLDRQSARAFAKKVGFELLLTGRYGLLADFRDNDPKNTYLVGYEAENIYAWRTIIHKGRSTVDRIILIENESILNEYGTTDHEIYRILRLDPDPDAAGELIYSQEVIKPDANDAKGLPIISKIAFNSRGRTLRYIPFIFINTMDNLPAAKSPPLTDIATLNLSHYGSTAHLEHGRFYAGMPTYVTSGDVSEVIPGLGDPNPRTVGPSNVWELPKDSKAWLLEFTGSGLSYLENAVDSKQLQMQSLGGRLISSTRRAAAMSSEAWELLETGDEATLLDIAECLDISFALALSYVAHIRGDISDPLASGILAEFNKEFVRTDLTAREIRALQSLYERGVIPLDVMYYALREVHVIPIEYSLEDFKRLLDQKEQKFVPPPLPVNPNLPGPGVRTPAPRPVNTNPPSGSPE